MSSTDEQATEQAVIVAALHRAFHDHWTPGDTHSLDLYPDGELWVKQAEAVERIVAERFLRALRYAQSMALTAKAYGWEDREWLDMIILLGGDAVLAGKALIATIKADAAAYDAEDPLEPIHNMLAGGGDDE